MTKKHLSLSFWIILPAFFILFAIKFIPHKSVESSVFAPPVIEESGFDISKFSQEELEICEDASGNKMYYGEAKMIAQDSDCMAEGALAEKHFCNDYNTSWWIDLDKKMEGCSPACVVEVATKQTQVNYRCTGLLENP